MLNCKSTDSGIFITIKIVNALGEVVSNKATLNVNCGPVFVVEPTEQKVLKDKEAKFECIVKSNPKPNLIWLLNGKEFTSRDGVRIEKDAAKDKYTLVIPKVTPAHIGTITAKATNEFGSSEKNVLLDVLDSPRVLNKLDNATVNENEPVQFTVKYSGKPKPAVKWFKDEIEIQVDETIELTEVSEEEICLKIKSCKSPENMGTYYAKVSNEFGEVVTNKATLTINSKRFETKYNFAWSAFINFYLSFKGAPKFVSAPKDTVAIQDQAARFECLIDALPKPKLVWILNDKELTNKDNVKFETDAKTFTNSLVIPKISASHLGKYVIKASNNVGEVEHTFNLDVLGKAKRIKIWRTFKHLFTRIFETI